MLNKLRAIWILFKDNKQLIAFITVITILIFIGGYAAGFVTGYFVK